MSAYDEPFRGFIKRREDHGRKTSPSSKDAIVFIVQVGALGKAGAHSLARA